MHAGTYAADVETCECLGYAGVLFCGDQVTAFDPVERLNPPIEARQAELLASAVLGGNEETANLCPKLLARLVASISISPASSTWADREAATTGPHLPDDMMPAMLDSSGMTETA